MSKKIHVMPRLVAYLLGGIALYLAGQSLFNEFLIETFLIESSTVLERVLDLFSVNLEESIPTWYSTINLFVASALLAVITHKAYHRTERFRHYWAGLTVLFLYLSIDEGAAIHEIAASAISDTFNTTGFFAFGWQFVAFPLVLIVGLIYLRFVIALPATTRNLFIVAAITYVGGALIVEGISANQWYNEGTTLTYLAIATVEELCEMLGVVVFIYALLHYLRGEAITVQITTPQSASEIEEASTPKKSERISKRNRKFLVTTVGVIVAMNIVSIVLTYATSTALNNEIIEVDETSAVVQLEFSLANFFEAVSEQHGDSDLLIAQMNGIFGVDSMQTDSVARSLVELRAETMIIALPSLGHSFIFAAESLSFDRNDMVDLLTSQLQTEFIIFETPAIRAILGQ